MSKIDVSKLIPASGKIKLGGKSFKIGDPTGVQISRGKSRKEILEAISKLSKIDLSAQYYASCD